MKIAISSSGLGHVSRGVETWAMDTAEALHHRGRDVTLFAADSVETPAPLVTIPCLKRRTPLSNTVLRLIPSFAWRWGLNSAYGLEQFSFWRNLRPHLRRGEFDILHLQDPMVAYWCRRDRQAGRLKTKEVLAHGTEEPASFLAGFDYVQHLMPFHRDQVVKDLGVDSCPPGWIVSPNFVDTSRFAPVVGGEERSRIRVGLNLPPEAFVVGCSAAVKRTHKRLDYLVDEFAALLRREEARPALHLVIAGAREAETDELVAYATKKLGNRVTFLLNHPLAKMPQFYQALDVFVLPSLFEMMGIVLVEAMSSGVPCIVHRHPVMATVVGPGGAAIDMDQRGVLSDYLRGLSGDVVEQMGGAARSHVEGVFSTDVVIEQYLRYYERILESQST